MPSEVWTRDILQLAHSEPAVWHAVVTLGGLHYRWHAEKSGVASSLAAEDVERHYHKAVSLAQSIRHEERALSLSLALGAAANLRGELRESRVHIASGRKLLCVSQQTDEVARAADMLVRLDLEALSFGEVTAPYEAEDLKLLRFRSSSRSRIESYEQAADGLLRLMRILMMEDPDKPCEGDSDAPSAMDSLMEDLRLWEEAMEAFERRNGYNDDRYGIVPALSIRVQHAMLRMFLVEIAPGPLTRLDGHLGLFVRIYVLAEALAQKAGASLGIATMEPGIIAPLFATGSRCRHPRVRARCISILKNLNRLEGLWRSDAIAVALQRVAEIEEDHMRLYYLGQSQSPASSESSQAYSDDQDNTTYTRENSENSEGSATSTDGRSDTLEAALSLPWTAWSEPGFTPPCVESWDGVPIIPEACRVASFQPSISVKERSLAATVIMSSWAPESEHLIPRQRDEKCWF